MLQNTQRFVAVRTTETLKGTSLGAKFPDPLPWDTIESLCKKYKVDAIVSLESFDSNFIVTNGSKSGQEKNSQGETINVSRFFARGTASVDLGFRIYDPSDKSIVDEYHFSHNRDWNGSGNSINDAIQTLTNRGEAVKQVSYNSGVMYGRRITPAWYTVSRTYYRKCKRDPDLAEGARLMEVNDWNNAIQALEKAVNNGKTKTRGRAAHNLAVVYEILGNLDQAKSWAQSAYAKYGNKISKDYLYDLNRRMQDQEVLDNQMGK